VIHPRPVYKPHSVQRSGDISIPTHAWVTIYLGRTSPCASCSLPRTLTSEEAMRRAASCPCLALLPVGVAWPPTLLQAPVVSYTNKGFQAFVAISPLPSSQSDAWAVCFCGPIRQVSPSRGLPGTVLFGVRTFLDPAVQDRDHPTNPG
jgi:hypothetical protein